MGTLDPFADVPTVTPEGWFVFAARMVRWKDGDTCVVDCLIDLGFEEMATRRRTIRLMAESATPGAKPRGINCPESDAKDPAIRAAGLAAWVYSVDTAPPRSAVRVTVVGYDKFGGRDDGMVRTATGVDVAAALVATGHAVFHNY